MFSSALLVGQLDGTEWRLKTEDKNYLEVLFVYRGIDLVKKLEKNIFGEVLIGQDNMDPCAFILGIWREEKLR